MNLKELIQNDNDNLFFSEGNFAEQHTINGISCMCVVDDDRLLERTDNAAQGTFFGEKLLFIKTSALPGKPAINARMTLDGKTWYVRSVTENMGIYEIRLGANQT